MEIWLKKMPKKATEVFCLPDYVVKTGDLKGKSVKIGEGFIDGDDIRVEFDTAKLELFIFEYINQGGK